MLLAAALLSSGCTQSESTLEPAQPEKFWGESLRVACSREIAAPLVQQVTNEWAVLQGVDGSVTQNAIAEIARREWDVAIVNVAELPLLAESGLCLPVPESIKSRDSPYQWDRVLPNYTGLLAVWDRAAYGIPLFGEGMLLAYRKDRFTKAKLPPPRTWDEFAAASEALARDGGPALPGLPQSAEELAAEFFSIAACYDRREIQQGDESGRIPNEDSADEIFSFYYRLKTLQPRVNTAAFVSALSVMQRIQGWRCLDQNANDLAEGRAGLAILNLKGLARCQRPESPVRGKIGIAPLPGSQIVFDLQGSPRSEEKLRGANINRIPYIGSGSWIGVVSKRCANPQLAFEFLASFANPEKTGAEIIISARWGAGPLRSSQTEADNRGLWFGYGLAPEGTDDLLTAIKQHLAVGLVNRRYRMRLPNQGEHLREFDRIIRPALQNPKSDPQKALDALAASWASLWSGISEEKKRAWLFHAHGL